VQLPDKKLSLGKGGLGMTGKKFEPRGANLIEKSTAEEGANGQAGSSASDDEEFMDTDEEVEDKDSAERLVDKSGAEEAAQQNQFFMVDTNPTPVNLNGHASKRGKKRSKGDDGEERKAKKSKIERSTIVEPKPEKVDFTAVEAQLKAEIAAGLKAKEEQEKARAADTKLEKKEKKRKRSSTGDAEKEVKKAKKDKTDRKKRKAEDSGGKKVLSDEGSKKRRHRVYS
jgi:hypothetical protein